MTPLLTASVWALLSAGCFTFVSTDQTNIGAEPGQTVILPCKAPDNSTIIVVEWSRSDLKDDFVLLYRNEQINPSDQHPSFLDRVDLKDREFKDEVVSLVLRNTTTNDSGTYQCWVAQKNREKKLISTIILDVAPPPPPEPFPNWAIALLVLMVLVPVAACLLYHFRHRFMSEYKVEVKSGVESVLLPFKTRVQLPGDTRVEWRDRGDRKVHVYQNGSDQPEEQDQFYSNRTRMNEDPLRTGDLSLTLRRPTDEDSNTYTCSVSSRDGDKKKQVCLKVKVPQVEVESGSESVLLPCRTRVSLPEDARVEWRDKDGDNVHVYRNGSDQSEEQNQFYRTRTKLNEDPLRTKDLSLTLKHPTDGDRGTYTCNVSNTEGDILMGKQVHLEVKVQQQIKVDSGVKLVLLPCKTEVHLPENCKVEWKNQHKMAYVYENGSGRPEKLSQFYKTRTRMNEDPLRTGDLSLTLSHPTYEDSETYTCTVYSREGVILIKKQVQLEVKACQVEVKEGAESVVLPFITTPDLPGDAEVEWRHGNYEAVHVYQSGSDLPGKQHQFYKTRTGMNEDPLRTGDLSLSLRRPTVRDSGQYRCDVYSFRENLQREKTVLLRVKERRQDHDRTPLLQFEVLPQRES